MNSVNIVYLFGVLCILVSPSLTAPQSGAPPAVKKVADESQNELGSVMKSDAETFLPVNSPSGQPSVGPVLPGSAAPPVSSVSPASPASPDTPQKPVFMGGSTGIISKMGIDGPCMYWTLIFSNSNECASLLFKDSRNFYLRVST